MPNPFGAGIDSSNPLAGAAPLPAGISTPTTPTQQLPGLPGAGPAPSMLPQAQAGLQALMSVVQQPEEVPAEKAISKLRPGSELHQKVLNQLDARLKFSRTEMKKHYARWNYNEQRVQAYSNLTNYEEVMNGLAYDGARPPEPVEIIVPYTYATIHAAATYIHTVLLGRKPVFPLLATRGTETERARYMEAALQSQIDASRGFETLWQGIWDSLCYGFGPKRVSWEERSGPTVRFSGGQRTVENTLNFAGNVLTAVDPYAFFPDPRVPISQCNMKGDFIFTEMQMSEVVLRDMEREGSLMWVKEGLERKRKGRTGQAVTENRRRVRLGIGGEDLRTPANVTGFSSMHEGTVRIVPKDWGLGDSSSSELWKFSWFEGAQVMQAEPLGMVHNQHPYVAAEPTSFGHDFMSLSMVDMIGSFQEVLSWLVSSRMENVRSVVQNSFVADPARIEVNDIRSSPIGRIIRLKQTAMGLPVKDAIMQLVVQDVTLNHLSDMQNMRILADTITGVNDNMRGIQTAGGRRSATEARISMQAGGSRLSQHAIRISAQAYHPMVQQMIYNIQQFMPDELWIEVTGDDRQPGSKALTPDMLVGDYNYQISDGTLPFDKEAMVEQWKEILLGVAQDPELRQEFSIGKIFEYVAELGGAKNIDSFKRQLLPAPPMIQTGAQANPQDNPALTPIGPAMPTGPLMAGGFGG